MKKNFEECNASTVKFLRSCTNKFNIPFNISKHYNKMNRLICGVPRFKIEHLIYGIYCRRCKRLVTTEHVILYCLFINEERNVFKKKFTINDIDFTLTNILSNDNPEKIKVKVAKYINTIDEHFQI